MLNYYSQKQQSLGQPIAEATVLGVWSRWISSPETYSTVVLLTLDLLFPIHTMTIMVQCHYSPSVDLLFCPSR